VEGRVRRGQHRGQRGEAASKEGIGITRVCSKRELNTIRAREMCGNKEKCTIAWLTSTQDGKKGTSRGT